MIVRVVEIVKFVYGLKLLLILPYAPCSLLQPSTFRIPNSEFKCLCLLPSAVCPPSSAIYPISTKFICIFQGLTDVLCITKAGFGVNVIGGVSAGLL